MSLTYILHKSDNESPIGKTWQELATLEHNGTSDQSLESVVLVTHNCFERIKLFISLLKENSSFFSHRGNGEPLLLWNKISMIIFLTCI